MNKILIISLKGDLIKINSRNVGLIFKGVVVAFVVSVLLMAVYAGVLVSSSVSEASVDVVIIGITGISIMIGSILVNVKMNKNGLINGGIIGFIYILIMYVISSMVSNDYTLNKSSIIMIIVSIVLGMLGGIIGINKKQSNR